MLSSPNELIEVGAEKGVAGPPHAPCRSAAADITMLERLADIAARALGVAGAFVALVDADEVTIVAARGLAADDLPAARLFCAEVMRHPDVTVVNAAPPSAGARQGDIAAGFRAGAPIRRANGSIGGALCVRDPASRDGFSQDQAETLATLARLLELQLAAQASAPGGERYGGTEESFRYLFDMNPAMMWVFDDETMRFLAVNRAASARFGYSRDEFLAMTIFDVRPPEEHGRLRLLRDGYKRDARDFRAETWVFVTREGERFQGELSSYTNVFEGRPARFTVVRDVTERRRAEAKLLEREASFRYLFDQNPNPMVVYADGDLRILAANDAALRLYDCDHEVLLALSADRIRESERDLAPLPAHGQDSSFARIEPHRRVTGETFPADVRGSAINFEGRPAWLVVVRDISEQRQAQAKLAEAENKLRQSQKLEAIGHLTGGIAHDFNNLLTVILGNIELLRDELRPDSAGRDLLDGVARAADRGADLTSRLLAFARRQTLAPHEVDVDVLLGKMHALLARSIGEHIVMDLNRKGDAWTALVDPAQFETTVLNLVVNARDAMPAGGTIDISIANATLDTEAESLDVAAGDYVVVTVADTGIGMTPDVLSQAFDPFFTTKEQGKGTGLGLSMVYGFVRQSGGGVRLESKVGRGTVVTLYLPRAPGGEAPRETAVKDAVAARGGGESVLLVEDDPRVRQVVEANLRSLGYRVLVAADGREALDILNGPARIDLLLSDIVMPGGMNGRELAELAVRIRRGLRVLLASGYSGEAFHGTGGEQKFPLLRKPYRRHELASRLRELLDSRRRP